jgi:hypothetical protein
MESFRLDSNFENNPKGSEYVRPLLSLTHEPPQQYEDTWESECEEASKHNFLPERFRLEGAFNSQGGLGRRLQPVAKS